MSVRATSKDWRLYHGAIEEKSMPAYMVFTREKMRDEKEYEIYKQKNRIATQGHPIKKDVLYGKYEVLEGAEVQGVVILEFPTVADAKAYYDSPAYREAREHRFKAADYRVLIVEGVQPT
jgi:uncharacterized protein (DUF1330 family)